MDETSKGSLFDDEQEVLRRFQVAVREVLLDHKRAGNSVAVWQDGKVVIVPPGEIEIDTPKNFTQQSGVATKK